MDRLKRWTKNLMDVLAFGLSAFLVVTLVATMIFSAYAGLYVMRNLDGTLDDMVRATSKLEGIAMRIDEQAQYIAQKTSRLEKRQGPPAIIPYKK